jgi:hypothetical protein
LLRNVANVAIVFSVGYGKRSAGEVIEENKSKLKLKEV